MARKPMLTSLLCSDAKTGRKLNPSACQTCISPCEYGKGWLRQLGLPLPKETRTHVFYDIPELETTLKAIHLRRNKSILARRG